MPAKVPVPQPKTGVQCLGTVRLPVHIVVDKEIAERLKVPTNTVHSPNVRFSLPRMAGQVACPLRIGSLSSAGRTLQAGFPACANSSWSSSITPRVRPSSLAAQPIAAGYAKSVGQVWHLLNELMEQGLVGRTLPESWFINEEGRTEVASSCIPASGTGLEST